MRLYLKLFALALAAVVVQLGIDKASVPPWVLGVLMAHAEASGDVELQDWLIDSAKENHLKRFPPAMRDRVRRLYDEMPASRVRPRADHSDVAGSSGACDFAGPSLKPLAEEDEIWGPGRLRITRGTAHVGPVFGVKIMKSKRKVCTCAQ
jgi:hypothetical protein